MKRSLEYEAFSILCIKIDTKEENLYNNYFEEAFPCEELKADYSFAVSVVQRSLTS